MYISDKLKWSRRLDLEKDDIECMWIEIYQSSAKNFLVGSIYRPPVSSKYLPKNFTEIFKDVLDNISKDGIECIILGDLNANYLNKNDSKELKDIILLN